MTHKQLLNSIIRNGNLVEVDKYESQYEITNFWELYNQVYNDINNYCVFDVRGYHVMFGKVYFHKWNKESNYRQLFVEHISFDKNGNKYCDGYYQIYDIFEYNDVNKNIGTKEEFFETLQKRKQYIIENFNLDKSPILRLNRYHNLRPMWDEYNDGIFFPQEIIINYKYNRVDIEGKFVYLNCGSLTCDPYYITANKNAVFTDESIERNLYIISEKEKEEVIDIWESWEGACRYWDGRYNFKKRIK